MAHSPRITIRVSPELLETLQRRADASGLTLTEALRHSVITWLADQELYPEAAASESASTPTSRGSPSVGSEAAVPAALAA